MKTTKQYCYSPSHGVRFVHPHVGISVRFQNMAVASKISLPPFVIFFHLLSSQRDNNLHHFQDGRHGHQMGASWGRRLVFEHRCLREVGRICWENFVSNSEVRRKELGFRFQPLEQVFNENRLRWMGHVLCMRTTGRLSRCMPFLEASNGLKIVGGG